MSGRILVKLSYYDENLSFKCKSSTASGRESFIKEMIEYTDWGKYYDRLSQQCEGKDFYTAWLNMYSGSKPDNNNNGEQ